MIAEIKKLCTLYRRFMISDNFKIQEFYNHYDNRGLEVGFDLVMEECALEGELVSILLLSERSKERVCGSKATYSF